MQTFVALKQTFKSKDIILYLIMQELKSAHRDKLLGNVWALLDPLCMMIVFYFVFSRIGGKTPVFMLYFLSGIVAWESFSRPLQGTALCLKRRKDLIQKFPIPLGVFPTAITLQRIYDFMWGFLAYMLIYFALKIFSDPNLDISFPRLLLLPCWMVFYLMFTLGICFIVARVGVFFADMEDIIRILLQMGYFLNPIFIDMSYIPEKFHTAYLMLNPLAGYMIYLRHLMPGYNLVAHNVISIPFYPLYLAAVSIAVFVFGFAVFQNGAKHYSKFL